MGEPLEMNWLLWKLSFLGLWVCHRLGDRHSRVRSYFYGRVFRYWLRTPKGQQALQRTLHAAIEEEDDG